MPTLDSAVAFARGFDSAGWAAEEGLGVERGRESADPAADLIVAAAGFAEPAVVPVVAVERLVGRPAVAAAEVVVLVAVVGPVDAPAALVVVVAAVAAAALVELAVVPVAAPVVVAVGAVAGEVLVVV